MKTQLCLKKGIQLIHIFEDQWLNQIYENRIYARKCIELCLKNLYFIFNKKQVNN